LSRKSYPVTSPRQVAARVPTTRELQMLHKKAVKAQKQRSVQLSHLKP